MICRKVKANLVDLLLDPEAVPVEVRSHLEECEACRQELASLKSTMSLMDDWESPEPSPYFDSRLTARLREEQRAEPAGFLERMQARFLFGSNISFRPLAAGALALLLIIGGGTYAGLTISHPTASVQASPTLKDLQSLDENSQVFQQLTSLDQNDQSDNGNGSADNL
jgi:predicted anti-sigma-YlaC factor YlaD